MDKKTVLEKIESVFESSEIAQNWLNSPVVALAGKKPKDLLHTNSGLEDISKVLKKVKQNPAQSRLL